MGWLTAGFSVFLKGCLRGLLWKGETLVAARRSASKNKLRIAPAGTSAPHVGCSDCVFRTNRLFCDLPLDTQNALDAIKHIALFPAKTTLFREGVRADSVCVLCTGRVKLSMSSPAGRTLTVRNASPGEVLGLSACLSGGPHQVTADTLEDTQVAIIAREDFLTFLHEHTDACTQVLYFLSDDLRVAYDRVRRLEHSHPSRWGKQPLAC